MAMYTMTVLLNIAEGQQTRHIETHASGSGETLHSTGIRILGSNQLVFEAKGSRDAILRLATHDK